MRIRYLALLATSALCCLNAATPISPVPLAENLPGFPLAIYYYFDAEAPPPAGLFTELQSELGRILAPAGLRVAWRAIDGPRDIGESFPEVVVFRFHGSCAFDSAPGANMGPDPGGLPLAQTQLVDGRILPFGKVNCDLVRRFIAPAAQSPDADQENTALGRALARVTAHEIYHMLTGSETHASRGIAQSTYSRRDLTEATFRFAAAETNWLRDWVEKRMQAALGSQSGDTKTVALSSSFAGR